MKAGTVNYGGFIILSQSKEGSSNLLRFGLPLTFVGSGHTILADE